MGACPGLGIGQHTKVNLRQSGNLFRSDPIMLRDSLS